MFSMLSVIYFPVELADVFGAEGRGDEELLHVVAEKLVGPVLEQQRLHAAHELWLVCWVCCREKTIATLES